MVVAYSALFCLICISQVLKQRKNKAFSIFDKIKVSLCLDDTSPRCTCPAKATTKNAILQKSTLPNVNCTFKFNALRYLEKSDLLTYFEKRKRVLLKSTVLYKL